VDLALLGDDDPLCRDRALQIVKAATQHNAHPWYLLQTGPGIGHILRLVLLDASHDLQRVPRVQACVSSCRLGTWAKESAGPRDGTAGATRGNASLTWACSAAAVLLLRDHPTGHKSLTRLENTHGQGQALTRLAQTLGRAVSSMVKCPKAFDRPTFLQAE
jgi:hypothetical protein